MTKAILTNSPLETVKDRKAHSVFDVSIAINPLAAACAPLLSIATKLRDQDQSPNLPKLYESLSLEIKLFEEKAYSLGYRSPVILAARYFLCALIDEIISCTAWGKTANGSIRDYWKLSRMNSGTVNASLLFSNEAPKMPIFILIF